MYVFDNIQVFKFTEVLRSTLYLCRYIKAHSEISNQMQINHKRIK
jgi:hypothetical protein